MRGQAGEGREPEGEGRQGTNVGAQQVKELIEALAEGKRITDRRPT